MFFKTVNKSNSARVLVGCKPTRRYQSFADPSASAQKLHLADLLSVVRSFFGCAAGGPVVHGTMCADCRTTPGVADRLTPLEQVTSEEFIPAIINRLFSCTYELRNIMALPPRYGGTTQRTGHTAKK